ncbi:MAG: BrnA antitoxin family protein [Gemmatimonadetes bacterium]|nr:BrnA antitoxin family protein [Gemmatimonadota bacterium]
MAGARVVTPVAKAISIRLDGDLIAYFRATGPRYQTRINAVLRSYVDQVKDAAPPTRRKRAV